MLQCAFNYVTGITLKQHNLSELLGYELFQHLYISVVTPVRIEHNVEVTLSVFIYLYKMIVLIYKEFKFKLC